MTIGMVMTFYITIPKAHSMKETVDELDIIEIKIFCSADDNVKRIRRQATD